MTAHIDGVSALVNDFQRQSFRIDSKVIAATKKAAHNVKTEAARFASGISHAPHYPRSITYDVGYGQASVWAEIGPDKNLTQGALGNILEYGTANNAPLSHLGPAFDRELPNWLKALGDAAEF